MLQPLRFLFVEDIPTDHELAERQLRGDGLEFVSLRVENQGAFLKALHDFQPDVIISDYSMPEFDGMQALKLALKLRPDIPFIVLTGSRNEEIAVKCIKAGASDYVIKEHANRLPFAVREALKQQQERKDKGQTEEQLRESEKRFRSLFENMLNGFAYCRMIFVNQHPYDFIYLEVNHAFERLTGLKKVAGKKASEAIPGIRESDPGLLEIYGRVSLTGTPESFEMYVESLKMWFSISVYSPQKEYFVAVFDVITERKQAEQALEENMRLSKILMDAFPCVALLLRPSTREIVASNQAAVAVGAVPGTHCFSTWGQRETPCPWCLAPSLWATGKAQHLEVEALGIVWDAHWIPVSADLYMHYAFDITERKQAELALINAQLLLAASLNSQKDVIFFSIDHQYRYLYFNKAHLDVMKFAYNRDIKLGMNILDCITSDGDRIVAKENYDRALMGESHSNVRIFGDVELAYYESVFNPIVNDKNEIIGATGLARNITDRKQAEQVLKETNDKLTRAQRVAHIGSWEDYLPTGELHWSEEMYHILGFPPNTPINMAEAGRVFPPEEEARFQQAMSMTINANVPYSMDYKIVRLDGSVRHIHDEGEVIRDENGLALWMFGTTQDITDRKQTEEALRNAHWRLGSIIEGAHVGTWEWNVQTGESVFNEVWAQIIGYKLDELVPISIKTWETAAHPDDLKQSGELLERHFAGELPYYDCERRMKHKDGHWVWVHDRGLVITRTADGKPLMMFGTHTDITARKQSEEALRASLAEKVVLLKEVHHRVKNNLASILSLISLQQEMLTDPAVIDEFTELSGRIHSMALVHTLLYQSETLTRIDMHDYFETLLSRLRITHHPGAVIDLNVAAQGVEMDLDNAIPCGLIVTELVTNAFKYAFPDGKPRPGEQKCKVETTAEWDGTTYTLAVSDNGVGFPAGLDWQTTKTLGLQLVVLLGQRQLDGQIELEQSGGTTFRLRFMPWK
jgi:PAS domain S-box-containing protein